MHGRTMEIAPITSPGVVVSQPRPSARAIDGRSAAAPRLPLRGGSVHEQGWVNEDSARNRGISREGAPCTTPRLFPRRAGEMEVARGLISLKVLRIAITGLAG